LCGGKADVSGVTVAGKLPIHSGKRERTFSFYKGKGNGGFAAAKQVATGW
jgi:hypothetical protein